MKMIFLLFVIALALMAFTGCKEKPGANEPGGKILQERCTRCHPMGVKKAHTTKEEWEQTVTKMIAKGVVLNSKEKTILIDFLMKYYKQQ